MWSYLLAPRYDGHRTRVRVVKEYLDSNYLSQGMNITVTISFHRSASLCTIQNTNRDQVSAINEAEMSDAKYHHL